MPSRFTGCLPRIDVLGDRQVRHYRQLLMHHADAGVERIAGGAESHLLPVDAHAAAEIRVHAGDDLHQRLLAGAVLADEAMDFAGAEREVDLAKRFDTAEGFRDAVICSGNG